MCLPSMIRNGIRDFGLLAETEGFWYERSRGWTCVGLRMAPA